MITVKDLTIEEKLRIICGKDCWHTMGYEGKVESLRVADGPVGLRMMKTDENGREYVVPATAYPSVQILANTWSRACAKKMGAALADDCLNHGVDILLAPGVNIKRHPLNGRNFEYFSEDPYLAGTLACEYITAVQEGGIGTCLKHYLANNLEYGRFHQTSEVDERTLREIYYRPFEIACRAKPVSAMCSYNRVNGVYASENRKGFEVLRKEFGFDGAIFSDWGAVRDRTASAKAGLDVEMAFHAEHYDRLKEDYQNGKISEEEIDACAQRVLDLAARCKAMRADKKASTTEDERLEIAKSVAAQGIVLLKNEGVLPLRKEASIAVSGCFAQPAELGMIAGGGSSRVLWREKNFDLPARLRERIEGKVVYEEAFRLDLVEGQNAHAAVENALRSDIAVVCCGTGCGIEYESRDRESLRLNIVQERAILDTAEVNRATVVILFAGGPIDISAWEDKVAVIVYVGFPGMGGDEVIADILTGRINPSGKLTETFPLKLEDVPAANGYLCAGVTRYQEGLDVGYRYFDKYRIPIAYPFGFGLSYSRFRYGNLKIKAAGGLCVEVSYEVENISDKDGAEVSQVYVGACAPLVYRPKKELKGYSRDFVKAGEKVKVRIELDRSAFAYWSTAVDAWKTDDGIYEIFVGGNVEDEALVAKIEIAEGRVVLS